MLAGSGSEPAAGPRHADRQREHHHRNNRIKHAPRVGPLHLRSKQARAVTEREEKDEAGRRRPGAVGELVHAGEPHRHRAKQHDRIQIDMRVTKSQYRACGQDSRQAV